MIGVFPGSFDPPTVAHLAIAEAAVAEAVLERLDLVVSRHALGKGEPTTPTLHHRLQVLEAVAASRPWLGVRVTDALLLADIAAGYDVLVMGADKWAQVLDPAWYGGTARRDAAVAGLPRVLVAPRSGEHPVGLERLATPDELHHVSSSLARSGATDLMLPEAASFDAATGAWTDPERYRRGGSQVGLP